MRPAIYLLALLLVVRLPGVALATEAPPVDPPQSSGAQAGQYHLGVADEVRVTVFDEPTLSGEFSVNSDGKIALPLIGDVPAAGRTADSVGEAIETALRAGYLRDPKVSVEVLTFRPFYILGEVNKPGKYPFSDDLTVLNAVATAGGFTYRADKHHVYIRHSKEMSEHRVMLEPTTEVQPGDTVRIGERYF
jgi:protein involved in polysaccharide export with SLBB domain